jgi:hypothetical protein
VLSLFGLPAHGQDRDGDRDNDKHETAAHPNGIVQDWSRRHVVYPRFGPIQSLIEAQRDPRAILSWQEQWRKDWRRFNARRHPHLATATMHRDWSISLGLGTTAAGMFPAKFGFDPTAAPTCADFAVFPVDATGSATQPNIVALQNLYSGGSKGITGSTANTITTVTISAGTVTAADVGQAISGGGIPGGDTIASVTGGPPATSLTLTVAATATNANEAITIGTGTAGLCSGRGAVATVDNSLQATTMWSYDINGAGGKVVTSPALSVDGTKIAFIETAAGAAHFHVLAWKSGDGFDATNGQNVLSPKVISGGFSAVAPVGASGTVTDLNLGAASDTLSSPFVEYNQDVACVGNDTGTLFRIKNVFCTIACTPGTSAAPSLDLSWPSGVGGGTLSVCAGVLTGPVVGPGGNIYVGCSDGKLYGISPTGTIFGAVTVGNGGVAGGVVDPPLADVVNGFVYAVSGNNGASSVLVQAPTNLSSSVTATLCAGGKFNLHSPAFNEDYFSCTPQAPGTCTWMIYALALNPGNTASSLWGVGFTGAHAMNSGTPPFPNPDAFPIATFEFSPATTFFDGTQDRVFESVLGAIVDNLVSLNVSTGTTFPPGLDSFTSEGSGTSGIIVDNNASGTAQADSVYFGVSVANTAVKLTQSGLL